MISVFVPTYLKPPNLQLRISIFLWLLRLLAVENFHHTGYTEKYLPLVWYLYNYWSRSCPLCMRARRRQCVPEIPSTWAAALHCSILCSVLYSALYSVLYSTLCTIYMGSGTALLHLVLHLHGQPLGHSSSSDGREMKAVCVKDLHGHRLRGAVRHTLSRGGKSGRGSTSQVPQPTLLL